MKERDITRNKATPAVLCLYIQLLAWTQTKAEAIENRTPFKPLPPNRLPGINTPLLFLYLWLGMHLRQIPMACKT